MRGRAWRLYPRAYAPACMISGLIGVSLQTTNTTTMDRLTPFLDPNGLGPPRRGYEFHPVDRVRGVGSIGPSQGLVLSQALYAGGCAGSTISQSPTSASRSDHTHPTETQTLSTPPYMVRQGSENTPTKSHSCLGSLRATQQPPQHRPKLGSGNGEKPHISPAPASRVSSSVRARNNVGNSASGHAAESVDPREVSLDALSAPEVPRTNTTNVQKLKSASYKINLLPSVHNRNCKTLDFELPHPPHRRGKRAPPGR